MFFRIYSILPSKIRQFWVRIEQSDVGFRLAKGAFWSLLGSFASQGLMLLASIIVARILGKTEFGELGMIRSTVNMFTIFAGFGLGLTATKYVSEFYKKDKIRTGKIIGLSTIFAGGAGAFIAIVLLVAAPFIAFNTINAPHLVNELRLSAIVLFFSSLIGAQTGTLVGYEAFKTIAKVNFISSAFVFPIKISFALLWGLPGSVIGFGLNVLLIWVLYGIAVKKESIKAGVIINYKGAWAEWPILYKFSLPALLSGVLVTPVMWACSAMLVNQPGGFEEMAIFEAANQWRMVMLFIPSVLSQIALPLLSGSANNQLQFNRILKYNILFNFIISAIMALIISFLSLFIMRSYGEGFAEGKIVLVIMAISTVLISINSVIGQAIAGKGRMWFGFFINLIWSIILLALTYVFLKHGYGALGLAYSFLISYLFHTMVQTIFVRKYLSKITSLSH